jgi:hypothetical protein
MERKIDMKGRKLINLGERAVAMGIKKNYFKFDQMDTIK